MKTNTEPKADPASKPSRREFLDTSSKALAATALAGTILPHVHAAERNTIHLAIIGCGGRGTGAVADAFESSEGPVKLVAMADVFEHKLNSSHKALSDKYPDKMDVSAERRFLGFDAYKKAIDCLRPGDVALLTTHSGFRPLHLAYAVEKGVNVFMEKSFAPDPAGTRRIIELGEIAEKKNLKIGAGLMCRHSASRRALIDKIRDGALGDIQFVRAYRMDPGYHLPPWNREGSELMYQISRPYYFLWTSGGIFTELMIHQIDECCWIKNAWPVSAHGIGGRKPGSTDCSQNLDSYSIEYTFADGAKAFVNGRYMPKCHDDFATFIHGTKCAAQFSGNVHAPTVQIYKSQRAERDNVAWKPEKETVTPYVAEWNALLHAIRNNRPRNEAKRAAYANLAGIMGRAAVHSGQVITWDDAMNSTFQFCPDTNFSADSPAPVKADAQGRYPVPTPGETREV